MGFRELCARPAEEAVDGLVDVYLVHVYWLLWTTHRDGLLLIPLVDQETFKHLERQHRALQDGLLDLLLAALFRDAVRGLLLRTH